MRIFLDRVDAGKRLAKFIVKMDVFDPVVIALPRGGVPIAYEVAKALDAPLDVLVVRKIGAPGNPEFGIGAITEDGYFWIDPVVSRELGVSESELEHLLVHEYEEVVRRVHKYRGKNKSIPIYGKTVIVVDDGLATGVSARVACRYLREQGARQVILAMPVCSPRSMHILGREADKVWCLEQPEMFYSVSQFYTDFEQVGDEAVIAILSQYRQQRKALHEIEVSDGSVSLPGRLTMPAHAKGMIVFAHGSGSSRKSPRNQQVAEMLQSAGYGTLLFDLLTPDEAMDRENVFDIPLLAERVELATRWLRSQKAYQRIPLGLFGASTGAAAALWASSSLPEEYFAVVSRGGRPDLAITRLEEVRTPTLLIVGSYDESVVEMNRIALRTLKPGVGKLVLIERATHLFEEPGALEKVAREAIAWFNSCLPAAESDRAA